jgi:fructokinase
VPVTLDTDVNAAALAEHRWGAARDTTSVLYLTVGTGIGGGALVDGRLLHGLVHPEMGHIRIPREPVDRFPGVCPFHGDCLEGLASGPAIERRWGRPAGELPGDHPAWPIVAHELGLALATFICTLSPQRIVLGGGVLRQTRLLPLVRAEVRRLLNGYVRSRAIEEEIDRYIVAPGLGERAGVLGAIALAS